MDRKLPRRRQIRNLFQRIEESTASLVSSSVPSPRSTLCQLCQYLRFQPLREGKVHFHGKPGEINESASSGCPLCSLIVENFDLGPPNIPVRLTGIRKQLSLQEKASLVEEGDIEALGVFNGFDRELENPLAHKLALYTTHDDIAAPFIKRRPPIHDFAAESTYRLIKSWLDICIFHHPGCSRSPVISKLPTRVIDVGLPGTSQDPTLFISPSGYKESYLALSYCWGNAATRFVLSKDKAQQLPRPRFPFDTLPRTIKDAVTITQKLGFRFLWVDALCIIQEGDDGEDFLRESVTMSQVYGNATLTIAAAGASSVDDGIFRKVTTEPKPEVRIPYDLPDGGTGMAFIDFEEIEYGHSRLEEPLNTRGWTFQERILSNRVVLFYKDQLSWDCTSTLINSNGPLNPLIQYNQDSPGRYSDHIAAQTLQDNAEVPYRKDSMVYWRTLIEFYTRRALTDTSDKLKAISGLAQMVKSKTNNDSYVAGLWLSDIQTQLFWRTQDPSAKRQDQYRAPTWSWASIDGQIRFWSDDVLNLEQNFDREVPGITLTLQPEADEFGVVLKGLLRIMGRLFPLDLTTLDEKRILSFLKRSPADFGLLFDAPSEQEEFCSTYDKSKYFFFYPAQRLDFSTAAAIFLKKVDLTYQRVGIHFVKVENSMPLTPPDQEALDSWHQWHYQWSQKDKETITIE